MKKKSLKDNKTLNVTKGKEYEVYTFMDVKGLFLVVNNVGDSVVMSRHEFED